MRNVTVVVKPDETPSDIIEQICQMENIGYDDLFAFSAIMIDDKLKINCLLEPRVNPLSPRALVSSLFERGKNASGVRFVNAPLEDYLTAYRPLLFKMVNKVYPYYKNLIPDKEDLMSSLFLTIVKLNKKNYYLHQRLIYRSFLNELNMEIRGSKDFTYTQSLDTPSGVDEDGGVLTLMDQLECPIASEIAYEQNHFTQKDYLEDMFEDLKAAMLEDMSQLSFDRILIQLKTQSVDRGTSYQLDKYRQIFCPDYVPKPNAKGRAKNANTK